MTVDSGGHLTAQVNDFATEVALLFDGVFEDAPAMVIERLNDRSVISPERSVPLRANGKLLAKLDVSLRCCLDSSRKYLAVEKSTFKLVADLDRAPIIRWDYERKAHSKPTAHIQVHGHRGALSHLLSQAGHASPHSMESLHIPVGGARFRPCLEDVVEFIISDCQFDAKPGWQTVVTAGRERWRRYQARSVVRDMPRDAADVLRTLGYVVEPPANGHPPDSEKALHNW